MRVKMQQGESHDPYSDEDSQGFDYHRDDRHRADYGPQQRHSSYHNDQDDDDDDGDDAHDMW